MRPGHLRLILTAKRLGGERKKHVLNRINDMNTIKLTTLLGVSVLACVGANAQVLTFAGLQNLEPIDSYYDGGLGGMGSGPGPNYGITFTSDSLAVIQDGAGGTGNFESAPGGTTVAFFLTGAGDTMDKASGFNTGFSFYYSAVFAGSVNVYSGLDGTGSLLATLSLATTGNNGPAGNFYNMWVPVGVTFAGTAESAVFSGSANYIAFSDITLGSSTAGNAPDHTGAGLYLLAGLGLAGAALVSRKQTAAA
jgi:hypothetical protein